MKKTIIIICIILVVLACVIVSCMKIRSKEENIPISTNEKEVQTALPTPTQEIEVSKEEAIKTVLKDEEWVKNNVMLQKTCFGEDASGEGQEITFCKVGEDKVLVQAYAYDEVFGIANTLVSYQDGKVVTFGYPSVEAPGHPGHVGYGIVPKEEILAEGYMHMGYYVSAYYKIEKDSVNLLASFEAKEYGEDGELIQNESGDILVDYTISIDGKEESGRTSFEDYEAKISAYIDPEQIEAINIPLTKENIELYVK